jgi:D-lactate dehydrogenase
MTEEALKNIAETTLANITAFEQGHGAMHEVSAERVAQRAISGPMTNEQ